MDAMTRRDIDEMAASGPLTAQYIGARLARGIIAGQIDDWRHVIMALPIENKGTDYCLRMLDGYTDDRLDEARRNWLVCERVRRDYGNQLSAFRERWSDAQETDFWNPDGDTPEAYREFNDRGTR